jgi:hypothetical protein
MGGLNVPESVREVLEQLRRVIDEADLPYPLRIRVARLARGAIVRRRKPGPKGSRHDDAYRDYKAGLRGLSLYRKHIRGHDKMSRWRRAYRERRLLNALQKRASREAKRQIGP